MSENSRSNSNGRTMRAKRRASLRAKTHRAAAETCIYSACAFFCVVVVVCCVMDISYFFILRR